MLDDLLKNMLNDIMQGLWIEDDLVRVKLLRTKLEVWFEKPNPEVAAGIRKREGEAYCIPVRIKLVNSETGKNVRGFDRGHLNPWWMRRFVYDMAAAVAYIEREWDVMSPKYVENMEDQNA